MERKEECNGCKIGHPSQRQHACCGFGEDEFSMRGCGDVEEEDATTREKWRKEALSMRRMNEEELSEAIDKMSVDERMAKVLTLLFDDIACEEKRLIADQLSEYRQTLAAGISEQESFSGPLHMGKLRLALNVGWCAFKRSPKEERKKRVWEAFYGCMNNNNNAVEELCAAFAEMSLGN